MQVYEAKIFIFITFTTMCNFKHFKLLIFQISTLKYLNAVSESATRGANVLITALHLFEGAKVATRWRLSLQKEKGDRALMCMCKHS